MDMVQLDRSDACHQQRFGDAGEARPALPRPHRVIADAAIDLAPRCAHLGADIGAAAPVTPAQFAERHVGGTVDIAEMRHVDAVFSHVLDRAPDVPFVDVEIGPVRVGAFRQVLHFEQRRDILRVIPRPDPAVRLGNVPGARALALDLRRDRLGIRDVLHHAFVAVITPGVERAFQQVAVNLAAVPHVRAQVLAIGVQHPDLPVLAPPHGQVLREIAQRLDLAHGQVLGQGNRIPAERDADIEIALGNAGPAGDFRQTPVDQVLSAQFFKDLPDRDRRGAGIGGCFLISG